MKSRLDKIGVELQILQRYGPENYFCRSAMEEALGSDLSSAFPLSEVLPIDQCVPGYSKALNRSAGS